MKALNANPAATVMGVEENEKTHTNQMAQEASAGKSSLSPYALSGSKRLFDLCFSLAVLPVALTLIILVFILYPFIDGFPILFRHERIGVSSKRFYLYKIRTYKKNEPSSGPKDNHHDLVVVPVLGNLLRMSRIDELPQIWNILKGDMSWVGPRPEQSQFVDKIINKQIEEDQFLNANITFKEIESIKKVLKQKLTNIYHLRIEYPE